jgi:hypothetical protein
VVGPKDLKHISGVMIVVGVFVSQQQARPAPLIPSGVQSDAHPKFNSPALQPALEAVYRVPTDHILQRLAV